MTVKPREPDSQIVASLTEFLSSIFEREFNFPVNHSSNYWKRKAQIIIEFLESEGVFLDE